MNIEHRTLRFGSMLMRPFEMHLGSSATRVHGVREAQEAPEEWYSHETCRQDRPQVRPLRAPFPRSVIARHHSKLDRITADGKDDRYGGGSGLGRDSCRLTSSRDEHCDWQGREIRRQQG